MDFVLAFRMAHETEDTRRFFKQVISILKEQGKMLIAEPNMHVGWLRFREIVQAACDAGFRYSGAPAVRLSVSLYRTPARVSEGIEPNVTTRRSARKRAARSARSNRSLIAGLSMLSRGVSAPATA